MIANASVAPSENIAGAGILYVEAGALKYRGPNGYCDSYRARLEAVIKEEVEDE